MLPERIRGEGPSSAGAVDDGGGRPGEVDGE